MNQTIGITNPKSVTGLVLTAFGVIIAVEGSGLRSFPEVLVGLFLALSGWYLRRRGMLDSGLGPPGAFPKMSWMHLHSAAKSFGGAAFTPLQRSQTISRWSGLKPALRRRPQFW